MTLENIQFVVSLATLVGFIFVAYRTFRDPDVRADKAITLLQEQIKTEKQISAQAIKTIQNDLHSLEKSVVDNSKETKDLAKTIVRLETILDERLPKKL